MVTPQLLEKSPESASATVFYLISQRRVPFVALALAALLSAGCGAAVSPRAQRSAAERIAAALNDERRDKDLEPLRLSETIGELARSRAEQLAAEESPPDRDEDARQRLVEGGLFARFALSHIVRAATASEVEEALSSGPIPESKAVHPGLTHIGLGLAENSGDVTGVLYMVRLVEEIDLAETRAEMLEKIESRRLDNKVAPLEYRAALDEIAADFARRFMDEDGSGDRIMVEAQHAVDGRSFALGRVTVTFQVAGDPESAVVPARTSDPALAYAGLGMAQGNHPEHEPGSLAVMLILAEPQEAHAADRRRTDLPPPKAMPRGETVERGGSPAERAWVATLAGNHRKAARLFERAHRRNDDPKMLYESARAHARNGDTKRAAEKMRRYAALVEGAAREEAERMAAELESGESIFTDSAKEKMSVEARRFFLIGKRLFDQGEWQGAIDAFQQAYAYAEHADIMYNIGLTHLKAGNIGQALEFFAEYQRLVPEARSTGEAEQLFRIGVELYRVGQIETAARHFAMAYSYLPIPDLVYNLALCHRAMGDSEEALRLLREFLDSEPPAEEREQVEEVIERLSAEE
jgi:tetratricopeptide (TPR) repeat protein